MPRSNSLFECIERAIAVAIFAMLAVGFAYSGVATMRLDRQLLSAPPSAGRNASVDANLAVVHMASGEELRAMVAAARWPFTDDVALVTAGSALSKDEVVQLLYSASYLLYPRRVWLATAPGPARHALVVSPANRLSALDLQ
jgi:hypothetical protein